MRKHRFFLLAALALLLRVLLSFVSTGYTVDMGTFQSWASLLYENGFSNFYGGGFADYPPVYMYVLYALGFIRALFNLEFLGSAYNLLTRTPAYLCEIGVGFLIYRLATERTIRKNSPYPLYVAAAWLFNPAVLVDSAVWGQVDAVHTLLLFISIFLLYKKIILPSYLLFGAAILTKPQSLFLAPVYLFTAYAYLRENGFRARSFIRLGLRILAAAAFMVLLALPFTANFDFSPVLRQYYNTLDSYAYGSVNAYNFFALIGGNWKQLDSRFLGVSYAVLGVVFIVLIIAAALAALYFSRYTKRFKTEPLANDLFFVSAALFILFFMFSVKMHERYFFPALAFLPAAYIIKRDRRILWLYAGFSLTFTVNAATVLNMLNHGHDLGLIKNILPLFSFINVALSVYMLYAAVNQPVAFKPKQSQPAPKNKKRGGDRWEVSALINDGLFKIRANRLEDAPEKTDYNLKRWLIPLAALTAVYAAVAFIRLGDTQAPQTVWTPEPRETALIDFGGVKKITEFQYMAGARHDGAFAFYYIPDGGQETVYGFGVDEMTVFAWESVPLSIDARYVIIVSDSLNLMLNEAAFRGADGALIPVEFISPNAAALTDEQSLVPDAPGLMNSAYFDEIYHARAGYEYVNGLPVYENTHPPLGKDLIALSVKLLGMTPFAWRLPGVLFGVLMVPLIYIFARRVLRSDKWAFFTAFIFTFDFMHFAQTRVATIDTYVVFFMLASYLFMYMYIQGADGRTLRRSLLLLCASGAFMGLAVASKWQGVYGALGLPLVFAPSWFKLLKRDKKAAWITAASCAAFFILIPLVIYALSYIPFVYASGGGGLKTVIDNQFRMFRYHSTLVAEHAFSSPWWSWPLNLRPIYYYARTVSDGVKQGISSFGNPAVWWFGAFVMGYCAYYAFKKRDGGMEFTLTALAAQYLPWALVARLTFIYHFFPSVPFMAVLTAWFFKTRVKNKKWAPVYAAVTLALFIIFYPVLSGMSVPAAYVERFLRWLPGWVLI